MYPNRGNTIALVSDNDICFPHANRSPYPISQYHIRVIAFAVAHFAHVCIDIRGFFSLLVALPCQASWPPGVAQYNLPL